MYKLAQASREIKYFRTVFDMMYDEVPTFGSPGVTYLVGQEHFPRVLEVLLEFHEECHRFAPVEKPVVVR